MKNILLSKIAFGVMIFISCNTKSQTGQWSSGKSYLNINNVSVPFLGGGDMFWDLINTKYFVPKTQNSSPIFAGALWIGGYDQNHILHTAAMTYRQNGCDFFVGPLDTVSAKFSNSNIWYNKVWSIRSSTVDSFN